MQNFIVVRIEKVEKKNILKKKLEMCPLEHEWPATYKVEAPLRVSFLEISRYSRHLSRAEPDVGCVYHHTLKRWTIYKSSESKTLTRRYSLAFEKFRDIRDIYRAPNRARVFIPSYYTTMNHLRECENYQIWVGPPDRHVQYFVGPANFLSVRHKITLNNRQFFIGQPDCRSGRIFVGPGPTVFIFSAIASTI